MIKMETNLGETSIEMNGTGPMLFADFMCLAESFVDSIVDNAILPRDVAIQMLAHGLSRAFGYEDALRK